MTDHDGGELLPDIERFLRADELLLVEEHLIWGAVNHLYGGRFLEHAKAKEEIVYFRTLQDNDGSLYRVGVEAWAYYDFDDDVEIPPLAHQATVTIQQQRVDLTDDLVLSTFNLVESSRVHDEQGNNIFEAWEIKSFTVEQPGIGDICIEHRYELQDSEGETPFEDAVLAEVVYEDVALTVDEIEEASCLEQLIDSSVTLSDRFLIEAMLNLINIPVRLTAA